MSKVLKKYFEPLQKLTSKIYQKTIMTPTSDFPDSPKADTKQSPIDSAIEELGNIILKLENQPEQYFQLLVNVISDDTEGVRNTFLKLCSLVEGQFKDMPRSIVGW